MDYRDILMFHPDAWGFPDASSIGRSCDPFDPFHGWYAQRADNAEKEMEENRFTYTLRTRCLPERTFQALALGRVPEWMEPLVPPDQDEMSELEGTHPSEPDSE